MSAPPTQVPLRDSLYDFTNLAQCLGTEVQQKTIAVKQQAVGHCSQFLLAVNETQLSDRPPDSLISISTRWIFIQKSKYYHRINKVETGVNDAYFPQVTSNTAHDTFLCQAASVKDISLSFQPSAVFFTFQGPFASRRFFDYKNSTDCRLPESIPLLTWMIIARWRVTMKKVSCRSYGCGDNRIISMAQSITRPFHSTLDFLNLGFISLILTHSFAYFHFTGFH